MSRLPRTLLLPLSWLYRGAVFCRNRHYDRPANAVRARVPVISVGNLTVGGTGKTPVVAWVAQRLLAIGRHPAIVSRGYGGTAGRGPLIVSSGAGPLHDASVVGDEPWWLAARVRGARVVVGSDRAAGAEAAAVAGADVVLLDDGFQHRRLARDLDLVLIDSSDPFGGGQLLPAGRLREPISGLNRAGVVLLTRSEPGRAEEKLAREVRRHNPNAPIVRAGHRATGFVDAAGDPAPAPPRAIAFCGIARPEGFRIALERAGIEVVEFRSFRDHHRYSPGEIDSLRSRAGATGATLVTTEKDLARLGPVSPGRSPAPALALRLEVWIDDAAALLSEIARATRGDAA